MVLSTSKQKKFLQNFQTLKHDKNKFQSPLILKMYGELNKMHLKNENRYILCNFIDQNSDIMEISEDIYVKNNEKSLNQLFLFAFNKAKKFKLLNALYEEYITSIKAISEKKEFNKYFI